MLDYLRRLGSLVRNLSEDLARWFGPLQCTAIFVRLLRGDVLLKMELLKKIINSYSLIVPLNESWVALDPELRPGELRPDNSGRLIQARPNSGPAIPIQAGPNSGPSHLRPAYPNSGLSQFRPVPFQAGLCHFRPVPFQAGPTQAGANSGRCQLRPSCPISGPFQFRFIPSQAGANSGQSQLRPSCPNSGRCHFRPIPIQAELS